MKGAFMRKLTLLTATVLSITCLGGPALTANAATGTDAFCGRGSKVIISCNPNNENATQILNSLRGNCNANLPSDGDLNELLNQVINQCIDQYKQGNSCSQNPTVPCPPKEETPAVNKPETPAEQTPTTETPKTETPKVEAPKAETPKVEIPKAETPKTEAPKAETPKTETKELSYQEQVVALVNAERAKEGLSPLTLDAELTKAAQIRAEETVTSFSHTRPNGTSFSTVLTQSGISYRRAGENIAYGYPSPEAVVDAWMNSEGHRANIMNSNFNKIGIGYYQTSKGVKHWSQLFTN